MGCGASSESHRRTVRPLTRQQSRQRQENKDLRLSCSKLTYNERQLDRLCRKFNRMVASGADPDPVRERQREALQVVVERLVQRLVCSIGSLDPRFSSKFLVSLNPLNDQVTAPRKHLRFRYLVRLDAVSTPALYPEYHQPAVKIIEGGDLQTIPSGYSRVQLYGQCMEQWAEFIGQSGYLRRDKVQERFVQLLAAAAARPCSPNSPQEVDESYYCGSPGKVVDPMSLYHILQQPSHRQMFYGPAESNESRFPDPRDCRIVLVEGVPETRLHISFLSPTAQSLQAEEDIEVVLMLGIGVLGWPNSSDFPYRMPLDHVDVLLGYHVAQMGYFLVPQGPQHSLRCEDRSSAWEMRSLTSEVAWDQHYSPCNSPVSKIRSVLYAILNILRSRGVKTINKYIIKTLLYWELEKHRSLLQWTPRAMSRRVLQILDRLLLCLRKGRVLSYMIPGVNLLLQETVLDEDLVSDGDILEQYLRQLCREGHQTGEEEEGDVLSPQEKLEEVMLEKWSYVMDSMSPPGSNRSTRLSVVNNSSASVSYTKQQISYVAVVFREMLRLKHSQQKPTIQQTRGAPADLDELRSNLDDLIYILKIMFEQAKLKLISDLRREGARRAGRKLNHSLDAYDVSTALLLDGLKMDKNEDYVFTDDKALVAKVLECMYKAIDSDSRVLAVVLRPFLNQLFHGSHDNCWFLHEWQTRNDTTEMKAIGTFSELVLRGEIDPLDGLMDSASKGWNWAVSCLNTLQEITNENSAGIIIGEKVDSSDAGLRLLWTPMPGRTVRKVVILPTVPLSLHHMEETYHYATLGPPDSRTLGSSSRYATIGSLSRGRREDSMWQLNSSRGTLNTMSTIRKLQHTWCDKRPPHSMLRESSPLTLASSATRRQGTHRGLGNIVPALISLQKLTVLQEISQYLPEGDRNKVLTDLKKLSKEVQRMALSNCRRRMSLPREMNRSRFSFRKSSKNDKKSKSATLPSRIKAKAETKEQLETYTCKNELTNETNEAERYLKRREKELDEELRKMKEDTLLGTCRLLRKQNRPNVNPDNRNAPLCTGRIGSRVPNQPVSSISLRTPFYMKVASMQKNQQDDT